jgi:PilZ domain
MERRSCTRLADSQLVMLRWEEHSATLKQLGNVADISPGGLGVLADHSIPVGTAVTVSCPSFSDFALNGIVKHLSRRSDCYFIGIEFASLSDTAALQFQFELAAA